MNLGSWEVSESANMVRVAVRQNDISNIFGSKSEILDSMKSRVPFVELKTCRVDESLVKPPNILEPDASINESQVTALLKKKAMTHDRWIRRHL
jgi:hypothetical protein